MYEKFVFPPDPNEIPVEHLSAAIFAQQGIVDKAWGAFFNQEADYKAAQARIKEWLWMKGLRPDLTNDTLRNAELLLWKQGELKAEEHHGVDEEDPWYPALVTVAAFRERTYELKAEVNLELRRLDFLRNLMVLASGSPPPVVRHEGRG